MLRIGIVGAENSHTVAIARTLNIEQAIPDAAVVGVWGETPALAREAAEKGRIPDVLDASEDFIGQVDGVVVDHRHARDHLSAAQPLLEAKIPLFIDKPFCYRLEEGKAFLARAHELGVPVSSYSVLPKQASFLALQNSIRSLGKMAVVVTTGPCDIHSRWGGVFFYGIHQVDMILRIAGHDVVEARVHPGAAGVHTATLRFESGAMAVMNLVGSGRPAFHVSVVGEDGRADTPIVNDQNSYLSGIREFVTLFRTGDTPETDASMLGPVAVLQALEQAIERDKPVRVDGAFRS